MVRTWALAGIRLVGAAFLVGAGFCLAWFVRNGLATDAGQEAAVQIIAGELNLLEYSLDLIASDGVGNPMFGLALVFVAAGLYLLFLSFKAPPPAAG